MTAFAVVSTPPSSSSAIFAKVRSLLTVSLDSINEATGTTSIRFWFLPVGLWVKVVNANWVAEGNVHKILGFLIRTA